MRSHRILAIPLGLALLLAVSILASASVAAGGRPFSIDLTGAVEVPPGDLDASGSARLWVNRGQGEVCFDITVAGTSPILFAHVHVAPVGVAGPVVVPLFNFAPVGTSQTHFADCVPGSPAVLHAILVHPASYYVNVHSTEFPTGAVRGQLSRSP